MCTTDPETSSECPTLLGFSLERENLKYLLLSVTDRMKNRTSTSKLLDRGPKMDDESSLPPLHVGRFISTKVFTPVACHVSKRSTETKCNVLQTTIQ